MLLCPECERETAYNPKFWGNPQNLENTVSIKEEKKKSSVMRLPNKGVREPNYEIMLKNNPVARDRREVKPISCGGVIFMNADW